MVITAGIISSNYFKSRLKSPNKCESRIKVTCSGSWSSLKNSSSNFCSASLQSTSKLSTSKLNLTLLCYNVLYCYTMYVIWRFIFFQEGTVTNPAIWLVLSTVRIFLSLTTCTVTARVWNCFVNELAVFVNLSLFTLPWTINQCKFTSVHF